MNDELSYKQELSYEQIEFALYSGNLRDLATEFLHDQVNHLSHNEGDTLILLCEKLLNDRDYGKVDSNRISVIKLLIALLPNSYYPIKRWLMLEGDNYYYEVQFTLFCFLDDVLSFVPILPEISEDIVNEARDYLNRIPSDEAHNAFMAADMLCNHWRGEDGIRSLIDVVQHGPNPVGVKVARASLKDYMEKKKSSAELSALINNLTLHSHSET